MVWEHISATKPHVAYAVVAFFSVLFSLSSLFIKEKLYLGEAPLATIYGLITGPHCLNWFNPLKWGNWMSITLEISRVLLCIEIVAVSVELPKKYVLRHAWSVFLLLFPCMITGFLLIGLFTWAILPGINFAEGLLISACITATDPVLAQAVVGKGKFAQRVPAHLRNLLTAESACNDGMSVPFTYLALNLIVYAGNGAEIAKNFLCVTVLYECVFGCILGVTLGYVGRKLLAIAERRKTIDAESFLAFYVMLAVLCAGFGSILGCDDLLASFCAGTAFAWDGWFTRKTEESHVSTVIDLLLNLSFFVYFGSIIPWQEFNDHALGLDCWRLICLAICVLVFRRIPSIMAVKRICPDINSWKEALFVGHFGPIGVGAVYTAIISVADLEAEALHIREGPTMDYPDTHTHYRLMRIIWPCVTFLILTSIIVHGTSVAVIVLGKHLQSMSFTLTFTRTETTGGGWTTRLPRLDKSGKALLRHTENDTKEEEAEEESDETAFGKEEEEISENTLHNITATPAGLRKRRLKLRRLKQAKKRKQREREKLNKERNGGAPEPVQLDLGRRRSQPSEDGRYSGESFSSYSVSTSESSNLNSHEGSIYSDESHNGSYSSIGRAPSIDTVSVIGSVHGNVLLEPPPESEKLIRSRKRLEHMREHRKKHLLKKNTGKRSKENEGNISVDEGESLEDKVMEEEEREDNERDGHEDENGNSKVNLPASAVVNHEENKSTSSLTSISEGKQGSSNDEETPNRLVAWIKARPEVLEHLRNHYNLKESDFDPIFKNGELRVPAHGYKDGKQLIIEDQHGEIMRRIPRIPDDSDQASIVSTGTIGSIRPTIQSIKRTLSRIGSRTGFNSESNEEEGHKNIQSVLNTTSDDFNAEDAETTLQGKETHGDNAAPVNPLERVVKTILPKKQQTSEKIGTIKDRLNGALSNKHKGRKLHISEKLHGFRLNDTIIIEDSEGNIVATYKINPKALASEKSSPWGGKILQRLGMTKKTSLKDDEEKNLASNATLIPENDTVDDSKLEDKIRAFMENPKMVRITRKEAREAARARLKRHLKEIDKEIREDDTKEQNTAGEREEDGDFEYYEDGGTESESERSENEKKDNEGRAHVDTKNSTSTGSSNGQDEEDDEEQLTRNLIEKQRAEGQARKRRREGSVVRRTHAARKRDTD